MKDTLIILGLCLAAVVLGAWLLLANPRGASPVVAPVATQSAVSAIPIQEIARGADAKEIAVRKNYLVQDEASLAKLWAMIYGASTTPPAVDFLRADVLAVFAGQRASAGYEIFVSKVLDGKNARDVYVTVTQPGSSCVTAQSVTSPFEVVTVPKTMLPLNHKDDVVTKDCPS